MLNICWTIDPSLSTPLYLQLYEQLKQDIITQALPADSKLPSIRDIAQALAISKTTVESAYQQLEMEGYIYARKKVGYFACDLSHSSWHHDEPAPFAEVPRPEETSAIRYDFSNDSIDPDSFDFTLWRKYVNQTLASDTSRFFDYGDPMGAYELRYELAKYLHRSRQVRCTPEQIVIGAGVLTDERRMNAADGRTVRACGVQLIGNDFEKLSGAVSAVADLLVNVVRAGVLANERRVNAADRRTVRAGICCAGAEKQRKGQEKADGDTGQSFIHGERLLSTKE